MASMHQHLADEFDPYLQQEDDLLYPNYRAQETYMPSPVSLWQISTDQAFVTPHQSTSTVQRAQTPPPGYLKVEPVTTAVRDFPTVGTEPVLKTPEAGGWGLEILSVVLSIACTVAMVIVLIKFDGKLLSEWLWGISPNAVVSVLSTASKAMMVLSVGECVSQLKWICLDRQAKLPRLQHLQLYDNASRGPLGSFNFFWRARGLPWGMSLVTYLGCFITIAALALDPFAQQILTFTSDIQTALGPRSSVSHAQTFDNGLLGSTGATTWIDNSRNAEITAAAVSGLYGYQSTPPFSCPGSNCTFPDFQSLGICPGVCIDVTAQSIKNCNNTCSCNKDSACSSISTNCSYTTPSGVSLQAHSTFDAFHGFQHTTINATTDHIGNQVPAAGYNFLAMGMVTFNNSDMLYMSANACDTSWQDTVTVYQCFWDLCAMSYENYTYVNGALRNGVFRSSPMNSTIAESIPTNSIAPLDKSFPGNHSYYFSSTDSLNIADGLIDIFGQDIIKSALYNSGNVSRSMEYAGEAISYRFMQGPNSTVLYGNVTEVETHIHVQWQWLSLTFVLVFVSAVFLFATMYITHKAHQHAWKSSLAPLLYADSQLSPNGARLGRDWTIDHQTMRVDTIRSGLIKKWG